MGELPRPATGAGENFDIIAVDPATRRMYARHSVLVAQGQYRTLLVTYDLTPAVPTIVKTQPYPLTGIIKAMFTTAVASQRQRLYIVTGGYTQRDGAAGEDGSIDSIDIGPNNLPSHRWTMAERLPGFVPEGITYSAEDDRLYAVGEMAVAVSVVGITGGNRPAGPVPTLAAFDPGTGALLWARPIPECGQTLFVPRLGTLVARSSPALGRPTLFFACATGAVTGDGATFPGQSGLVELRIGPKAARADAASFDLHFHPISGEYSSGTVTGYAFFDPGSDRFFMQSVSYRSPGAWVFDARLGGWAGFITSPNSDAARAGGINPTTGRYYTGGPIGGPITEKRYLIIADGRATPPQNGILADRTLAPRSFIFADPTSNRVFIPRGVNATDIAVVRDLTRSAPPLEPPDYDAQTDDVEEVPGTFVSFTGDTGGFGARVTAIGDTAFVRGPLSDANAQLLPLASRGLTLGRVPTAGVQPAGASASAQALASDTSTGQTLRENETAWPAPPRSCLDGNGEGVDPEPAESIGGHAEVRCTLASYEATARASQHAGELGPVAIGDAVHDTKVKRTAGDGMRTDTRSTATGIRVAVPGVGSLEIGQVETVVKTAAHGRKGTASATWTRSIRNVVVKDGAGHDLFRTEGCSTTIVHDGKKATASGDAGTCDALAENVRRLLQMRVRLFFPTPEVIATPKGAFARVSQTDRDASEQTTVSEQGKIFEGDTTTRRAVAGMQLDVYNDAGELSRYIVHLAAAEGASIYSVNRNNEDAPCDMGGCIPGGSDSPQDDAGLDDAGDAAIDAGTGTEALSVVDADTDVAAPVAPSLHRRPASSGGADINGLVFARRSLGDGGLMASFVLLVAAAVGVVARRRRLVLVGG